MLEHLPSLNALLNATSAVLLLIGHHRLKQGDREAHRKLMTSALAVSVCFLVSYLTYHAYHGTTRFTGEGWIRPVYFTILISHTILAACVAPLAVVSFRLGRKGDFSRHARIARWTYPIWLYVSFTGVAVYLMLYRLFPAP
jgi:putative membrane protein